jgi:hypothetical protein
METFMPDMIELIRIRLKRPTALVQVALLPVVLLLTSCATQPPSSRPQPVPSAGMPQVGPAEQATLRSLVAQQDRLYRVAGPLLTRNAELCKGSARNLFGFTAKNKYSYSAEMTDAAQVVLGLDDRLQVMGVLVGSGAARVGVRRGDKLVAVEDKPMPEGPNAERQAAAILAPLASASSSVKLTLLRDKANTTLTVPLTHACAYAIELGNTDNVNAYDDGRRVMITRGMMNFARSDEELAYVLAKEMAHNSLGHASKQNMSGTVSEIIDNLLRIQPDATTLAGTSGVRPMPQELDAAADTLSLYMLARAGYSIDNALRFWERLASQYPPTVLNGYTALHPSTTYRLSVMERIAMDVKAKQLSKKPLFP